MMPAHRAAPVPGGLGTRIVPARHPLSPVTRPAHPKAGLLAPSSEAVRSSEDDAAPSGGAPHPAGAPGGNLPAGRGAGHDPGGRRGAGPSRADKPVSTGRRLAALSFDIGAPIAVYYLLHGFGVGNLVALGAGAVLPALGAGYSLVARRRADGVALVVLATMVLSIAVSVVAHDPRFLLAKDGLITGLWGLWFVVSVSARRAAAFVFARPLMEGRRMFAVRDWDALWEAEPGFRRIWRVSSVLWGTGMLLDAAIRVVMSYTLPVHEVPALSGALWPVTFVVLQVITNIYYQLAGLNRMLGARRPNRPRRPAPRGP